jgi:potassium efflux system protein
MKDLLFRREATCLEIILIIGLSFLMPSVYAQDEVEKKGPQPIPTADIIKEAESASSTLKKMSTLLNPQERITQIEEIYPEYLKVVDELKNDPDMQRLDKLSVSKLGDINKKWMSQLATLKSWEESLYVRSEALEKNRISIVESKKIWEITQTAAVEEKVPSQMLIRIKELLTEINTVQANYRKRLDVLISLQNNFSDKMNLVNSTIAEIDVLVLQKQMEIFSIDSKSFWEDFYAGEEESDFSEYLSGNFQRHAETLSDFYDNYKENLIVHVILLITLLAFLLSLRHFGTKLIMDKEAAEISREILNHPYSVALLVTLLLVPQLYPRAPDIIGKLAQIISLIPVLRLVPVLYVVKIHKVLIIFIGIYFLNLIYVLSSEQAFIHRIFLLLVTILSLTFLTWIIRGKWLQSFESDSRLAKFGSFLIYLFSIFMLVSILANFIGNVSLAILLTTASLASIYFSFIMLAGSLVIIGLLNLVLSTKVAYVSRIVRVHPQKTRKNIAKFISFIAAFLWLFFTMRLFTILDYFYNLLTTIISERLQIGSFDISLGDILAFFLAIYASVQISRFIRFVLEEDVLVRMKLPRGVPGAVSMLTNYIIIGFGFMIALSVAGLDLSKFAILFGALGVGIGFGLQNVVNNFISGLILIFERPIQLRDTIAQGELFGVVTRIGIRSTTIRTFDGAEVIVPNSNLISNEVTNWTLSDRRRRIKIPVGVAYGTDPEKVLNILKETIKNNPNILETPEPIYLFREFGESSLNFDVRFWTDSADTWLQLQSDVTVAINNALKKAKIEIPFPQRDLHLRSVDGTVIGEVMGKGKR